MTDGDDPQTRRIAQIEGTLVKDVTFGWGLFARLDSGGTFSAQQAETDEGWVITKLSWKLTGKVLMLKTLNLSADEVFSDFQRLPTDMPFARAVVLIQSQQDKIAQNQPQKVQQAQRDQATGNE